ncbi:hypothetical protein WDW89_00750 [Deltaproteobacteria bacterium TL4]
MRQGKLKHLEYDPAKKTLIWHKPKADKEVAVQSDFYAKLPAYDITDIFCFVNQRYHFLEALTPLQPRYAKKICTQVTISKIIKTT